MANHEGQPKHKHQLLTTLPYDHFQRYLITAQLVELIERRLQTGAISILDVGGHSSSLKLFLPANRVVLADPNAPLEYTHRPEIPFEHDGYIRALGGSLPFPSAIFDLVTAHDTLEHVPPQARLGFLEDLLRTASRFVLVNGPVAKIEVTQAEKRLALFWERTLRWKEHFLQEHLEFGLPESEQLQAFFSERGFPFAVIPNGDFYRWFAMMALRSYLLALPQSDQLQASIDSIYNKVVSPYDYSAFCYREAFLVSKRPDDSDLIREVIREFNSKNAEGRQAESFQFIDQIVDPLERHAGEVSAHLTKLHNYIEGLVDEVRTLERRSGNSRIRLAKSFGELNEMRRALESTTKQLNLITRSPEYKLFESLYQRATAALPESTARGKLARKALRRTRKALGNYLSRGDYLPVYPYERWISEVEPTVFRKVRPKLAYSPRLSVLVMGGETASPVDLRRSLDSILAQHYRGIEVLVEAESPSMHQLRQFRKLGIEILDADQTASASTADFVCILAAGDVLSPHALLEIAKLLNRDPAIDFIYSDHDTIGERGERSSPFFTPSWSPDLLLSTPYCGALLVVRRTLLASLGWVREDSQWIAAWDLALRISEMTTRASRIPKILVHCKERKMSRLKESQANEIRIIEQHLARKGVEAQVMRDGQIRVKWKIAPTTVTIIIPTAHNRLMLDRCLRSLKKPRAIGLEVFVVDSSEPTLDKQNWYEELVGEVSVPFEVIWREAPFNYSAVNNFAANRATGDYLLFLNDDVVPLNDDWIEEMVGWAQQPGVGLVGAQLLYESGEIQHTGVIVGMGGFADHIFRGIHPDAETMFGSPSWYRNFLAVTGAAMMIRRDLFEEIGGWDEQFTLCGSDVEIGLRVRRYGYRVVLTPFARLLHFESSTRGRHVPLEDFYTSYWDYQPFLYGGDPYFNPNLSYMSTTPVLNIPDRARPLDMVSSVIGRNLTPFRQQDQTDEAVAFSDLCYVSEGEIEKTLDLHRRNSGQLEISTLNWFLPDLDSPFYGGIYTILRFADYFRERHGVRSRFIVLGVGPEPYIQSGIRAAFPRLADSEIIVGDFIKGGKALNSVPECDAAIATLWTTAYAVSKFERTKRKFYFIQDFEPMFYPAGTMYALAEQSYRLGLYGLCNTLPLKDAYESQYGGKASAFTPCVDTSLFHPSKGSRDGPFTVFLYGRPGHLRNCFELAVTALGRLKNDMKDNVRIVTAGSWAIDESLGGDFINSLGLLDYRDTPTLYRSCDVGLVLTVSKHPSYLPLELMASGCLVVQNENPSASWLLRDRETCLLATPTADSLYRVLKRGLIDEQLRREIVSRALSNINHNHSNWQPEMEKVFSFMENPAR